MRDRLVSPPIVAAISIIWNVAMTFVAILIDAPSQFGIRGNDPAGEWLASGTAISAPLLPLALLLVGGLFATRRGWVRRIGWSLLVLTAFLFVIGGIGEIVAEPTEQTSRAELVFGGVTALLFAAWLAASVVASALRARAALGDDCTQKRAASGEIA